MKCRGGRIAVAALALMFCVASDAGHTSQGLAEFKQGRFAEAFQEWSSAAEAGDARGALYVGVLYDTGLGVPQDYNQAMAWYRRASDAGSPAGAFNVGVLYDAGIGVGKDPAQAAAWYSLAAKRGFGRAEYNLGMLYETGEAASRSSATVPLRCSEAPSATGSRRRPSICPSWASASPPHRSRRRRRPCNYSSLRNMRCSTAAPRTRPALRHCFAKPRSCIMRLPNTTSPTATSTGWAFRATRQKPMAGISVPRPMRRTTPCVPLPWRASAISRED